MAVGSSPSAGRSTRARMLFQTLITSAQKSIFLTSPYFLPDREARRVLVSAAVERDVDVRIITPNRKTDHLLIRATSRRLYGELLQAGIVIAEYQLALIHTKIMIIDELWSVIGSTNFDYRSFGINDEVNLVVCDRDFAARLRETFLGDLEESRTITYETWRNRPVRERIPEWLGRVLEKQQ